MDQRRSIKLFGKRSSKTWLFPDRDKWGSRTISPPHLARNGVIRNKRKSVRTALIRRLMSGNQRFVDVAKRYIKADAFRDLLPSLIFPVGSHGKLDGKGAGIFLATKILETAAQDNEFFQQVKTPKTWHIASDAIFNFMAHNGLEDILEHKYLDIG